LRGRGAALCRWRRRRGQADLQLAAVSALQQDAIPLSQWRSGGQLEQAAVDLHLNPEQVTVAAAGGHTAHGGRQLPSGGGQRAVAGAVLAAARGGLG
jgi:hypothetical protein